MGKGRFGLTELRHALDSADDKELELYMATPGGSVAIADTMLSELLEKKKEGYSVSAILAGEVASAGSYLMLGADKIKAYPHVRVMIHNAWGEIEGNQHELQAYVERLKSIDNTMAGLYAQKTGKTADEMLAYMAEEKWFTADEALAIGLIDEIIPMTPKAMDAAEVYASWRKHEAVHIEVDTTQANTLVEQLKELFNQSKSHNGVTPLCEIGNKGLYIDARGRLFPCCWVANRYNHNSDWQQLANNFDLHARTLTEVISDPFWNSEFQAFTWQECQTKCTSSIVDEKYATTW
jgi:ATP-dependent Clp endopeptidase proteolytic subunit ClpP